MYKHFRVGRRFCTENLGDNVDRTADNSKISMCHKWGLMKFIDISSVCEDIQTSYSVICIKSLTVAAIITITVFDVKL